MSAAKGGEGSGEIATVSLRVEEGGGNPQPEIDQDVPTVYLQVDRAKYAHIHFDILPKLVHAGLHIDVLTSAGSLLSLHEPGALEASAGRLTEAAPMPSGGAVLRAGGADARQPPGEGEIFVRITAPDARLLREAARVRIPLPLCAHTLRAVDVARNVATRAATRKAAGDQHEEGIPSEDGADAVDPYDYIIAPYPQESLPEVTLGALREVARARGDTREPLAQLFSVRGCDGKRVLSDVNSLKMLESIIIAPMAPVKGEGGAGLSLPRMLYHKALVAVFAGHAYAPRELLMAAAASAAKDYRNYGVATMLAPLLRLCSSSGPKKVAADQLSPAEALEFSITSRDPRLMTGTHANVHVRMSEYVRGYLGERVALFFGFTEYMQSTLALLASFGTFLCA
jgi:hypothetical protein